MEMLLLESPLGYRNWVGAETGRKIHLHFLESIQKIKKTWYINLSGKTNVTKLSHFLMKEIRLRNNIIEKKSQPTTTII